MITNIQLLRNVGQFDSVSAGPLALTKMTLVYAENGRGKTTLANILRSVGNGDAGLIQSRSRLTAQHPPQVILRGGAGVANFQNGAWTRPIPDIAVFDDLFVSQNVCSGVEVEADHRQNLHELILGSQGVALNNALQQHVTAVEQGTKQIKARGEAIPAAERGRLTVDAFCALPQIPNIDDAIKDAERGLAAARAADAVRSHAEFLPIQLPAFDIAAINSILERTLSDLEADAAARVQAHLRQLGKGGEAWVAEGMPRVGPASGAGEEACPFCAQPLGASPLIQHYQAYFSDAYAELKAAIIAIGKAVGAAHEGAAPAAFERAVRVAAQTRQFWSSFASMPEVAVDTTEVARAWNPAREGVLDALRAKHAAPLERMTLSDEVIRTIQAYDEHRMSVEALSVDLISANARIKLVKEQTASANAATLENDLAKLLATKARHSTATATACQAYLDAKSAKTRAEADRDRARTALDHYRNVVFPQYEVQINDYLRRLGAAFRLGSVSSVNTRGGSSCTYNVVINNVPVSVTAVTGPSFRNTLSAGDRNTLALAFFFASLEHDAQLANKTLVIDDPMTSLDDHRNRNTREQMRLMLNRVNQIIVLSHSKSFLIALWENVAPTLRSALRLIRMRDAQGNEASNIVAWDVNADSVTEHDKRHERVLAFIQNSDPAMERPVAESLRPILETFGRVSYPVTFTSEILIGRFLLICRQHVGTPQQILSPADIQELQYLLDYANEFHHDTSPNTYQTVTINGLELVDFCQRVIAFARRA